MHTRRSAVLPSLSLVLPHPPLPRRMTLRSSRSSIESYTAPHTPRTSGISSPSLFKSDMAAPRRSTDSWSSSIADGGEDDMEWEWTIDQVALLGKTLDTLPAHLYTPFDGSTLPGNLADNIAKHIIRAKNPMEWPHSVASTRKQLQKLARSRTKEASTREGRRAGEYSHEVLQQTTNVQKKPLYRQSSMDFLKGNTLKDEASIERLSSRLQRAERVITEPRPTTPSASRPLSHGDDYYNPATPTEDSPYHRTIPTIQVAAPRTPRLRRSTTTISNLPTIQSGVASSCTSIGLPQQRIVTRIRRSESFSSHGLNGVGHSLKRAPSFGTISIRSHDSSRMSVDEQKENDPRESTEIDIYPSSDEEEKVRGRKTKKPRTSKSSNATLTVPKPTSSSKKASKTRLTRSSSIFGAELPHPQQLPTPPRPLVQSPLLAMSISPASSSPEVSAAPQKTLRRVKMTSFPPRPSRRISFGSLAAPVEEEVEATGAGLGSAFQLQ